MKIRPDKKQPEELRFLQLETMLPQGMASRYAKLVKAVEQLDDRLPETEYDLTDVQLNELRQILGSAMTNLGELTAYRAMQKALMVTHGK